MDSFKQKTSKKYDEDENIVTTQAVVQAKNPL
jgi:hypothetical protein